MDKVFSKYRDRYYDSQLLIDIEENESKDDMLILKTFVEDTFNYGVKHDDLCSGLEKYFESIEYIIGLLREHFFDDVIKLTEELKNSEDDNLLNKSNIWYYLDFVDGKPLTVGDIVRYHDENM